MNERIKELFGEALDKAVPETWSVLNHEQMTEVSRVFAELIVRDVLDEVLQAMDDGMDVYDTVADKFGVEE